MHPSLLQYLRGAHPHRLQLLLVVDSNDERCCLLIEQDILLERPHLCHNLVAMASSGYCTWTG